MKYSARNTTFDNEKTYQAGENELTISDPDSGIQKTIYADILTVNLKSSSINSEVNMARIFKFLIVAITLMTLNSYAQEVKDKDGNTYSTVKIGEQEWMAENLNVSHFRNGDPITEAKHYFKEWNKAWTEGRPAWCYYKNEPANGEKFGKLYNWSAVNDPRGLAPAGWHIASDEEWMALTIFLGGAQGAGLKMKSTAGWSPGLGNGTNKTGFTALQSGKRDGLGNFVNFSCNWWTSTENGTSDALSYKIMNDELAKSSEYKGNGYSIRCIKNSPEYENQLYQKVSELVQKKSFFTAIGIYKQLIEINPDNIFYWQNISEAYVLTKNYDAAIEYATKGLARRPNSPGLYVSRFYAYFNTGKLAKAESDINTLFELDPYSGLLETSFQFFQNLLKDNRKAIAHADRLIKVYSGKTDIKSMQYRGIATYYQALSYYGEGNKPMAYQLMDKAFSLNRSHPKLLLDYAVMLSEQNRHQEATRLMRDMVEANRNNPDVLAVAGEVFIKAGGTNEGCGMLRAALDLGAKGKVNQLIAEFCK